VSQVRGNGGARQVRVVDPVAHKPRAVRGVNHFASWLLSGENTLLHDRTELAWEPFVLQRKWQVSEHLAPVVHPVEPTYSFSRCPRALADVRRSDNAFPSHREVNGPSVRSMSDEDELLAFLVGSTALNRGGRWAARRAARRLPSVSATAAITVPVTPSEALGVLEDALRGLGMDFHRDGRGEHAQVVRGAAGSGAWNMNPTLFIARVGSGISGTGATISIRAVAKEGLIKQHSARRLVDRIASSLATDSTGEGDPA
jgi:hypothetical protein